MKEIKAVLDPRKLEALREALKRVHGFPGMIVTKAEAHVVPRSAHAHHSIKEELTEHVPCVHVEIVVPDDVAPAIYDAAVHCLAAGTPGGSVVWMTDVVRASFVRKTI
jgi:nitrogen regulatory protein P-II 1